MMLSDTYLTITQPSEGLFKEKGSKFLSFAFSVRTEEEIKNILASIRKEHYSARHCCFAWSLGQDHERYRVNDDGEPSGTAGRPIYGQIVSHNLTNILVVVVRYFGGTLLGVSGLIQAYKLAAADALDHAQIVTQTIEHILDIDFEYAAMNDLMLLIKEEQLEIVNSQFDLQCRITIKVRSSKLLEIESKIEKIEGILTRKT
ncbi:MAG: YigZ family protein [Prolixibacteraceae bacterium]